MSSETEFDSPNVRSAVCFESCILLSVGHGSTPIAICTGHELPVTCVDVNTSIGLIASGSVGK